MPYQDSTEAERIVYGGPIRPYVNLAPGLLTGSCIQLAANIGILWFAANHLLDFGEPIPLRRCAFASATLTLVALLTVAILLMPIPFLGLFIAPFVWWKGSIAAVEGPLDVPEGGVILWLLTTLIALAIVYISVALMTGAASGDIINQLWENILDTLHWSWSLLDDIF